MIDILTGTAFDAPKRFNHRDDELAAEFPSSVGSRRYLLNALRAQNWRAGGSPTPPKPYDAEVEYLESTGTQVIDIGIAYNDARSGLLAVDVQGLETSGTHVFVGFSAYDPWWAVRNGVYSCNANTTVQSTERALVTFDIRHGERKAYPAINGTQLSAKNLDAIPSSRQFSLSLFAVHSSATAFGFWTKCRIFSASFSDIMDLIPVRVGTVGYMYDRVSGELFGNSGTGAFVLGPDI